MSESNFEWNEKTVVEFFDYYDRNIDSRFHLWQYLNDFKKSKAEHKDYEILSYRNPNSFTDIPDADIISAKGSEANIAVLRNYPIHSVLRKSDGDIISIGDIDGFANSKVMRIYIENGKMCILTETGWNYLDKFKKVKQPIPLLVTMDDVGIFEGDTCWVVNDNFKLKEWHDTHASEISSSWKTFSTKEKAEDWVTLNKPCLSLKDIEDCMTKSCHSGMMWKFLDDEKLKQLAKNRL